MTESARLNVPATTVPDIGVVRTRRSGPPAPAFRPGHLALTWLCLGGLTSATLIMIAASLVRQDWMYPKVPMPATGPPVELPVGMSATLVVASLWVAAMLALAGVSAGLLAVRRGARLPLRPILVGAGVAVVILAVLPPAGSTDALDYASYGRILLLGHNPYLVPPYYLRVHEPAFGVSVPYRWLHQVSLYGPLATLEQFAAAKLGGTSVARIVFWLKLWNAISFGVVAVAADRVLRNRPAARMRAHLLWTANPLLLWDLIAAGHLDVVAAAAGLLGLLVLGRHDDRLPDVPRLLAAGVLIGIAAAVKIDYALFGIALAWVLRRSFGSLVLAGAGAIAVLGPSYAFGGEPALKALFNRQDKLTEDVFWRLAHWTAYKAHLGLIAGLLVVALAILLLWRMPPGDRLRPAIQPALLLSLAWLIVWPYQLPWYDAMIICVLVLYPASWLDWVVLVRLAAGTVANIPGVPSVAPGLTIKAVDKFLVHTMTPYVLLAAGLAVVAMAVTGQWGVDPAGWWKTSVRQR
ncbi:MAG TPA: hypothetical protein VGI58_14870 [Streptosporangiaceae bacterium]|jgi:hypothetical protein